MSENTLTHMYTVILTYVRAQFVTDSDVDSSEI